jgi:CelD/BcsL family acetyltransferase involved in cellulose biosynthesis
VNRHPEGRFCHLWGYKRVLEEAYGYKCIYLNVFDRGKRVGVFPSVVVSRGLGRLVSQPFNEYGGPLTQDLSAAQQKALSRLLMQMALEEGCRSVEIRGGIGCEAMSGTDLCVRHPLHCYAVLELGEKEHLWRHSLTNEARKGVNRARKAGLTTQIRQRSRAIEDPFYALYLASMKRLGVPPHSQRFFAKLAEELGDQLVAAWVMYEAAPIGVLLGVAAGQRIHTLVTASDYRTWSMRPNDLAHWELIEWAIFGGLRVFDLGSVRYPGQYHFKTKWGSSLQVYNYYCIYPPGYASSQQIQSMNSSGRFATAMSSLWRGIVPTRLTPLLGPPIRRYLTK